MSNKNKWEKKYLNKKSDSFIIISTISKDEQNLNITCRLEVEVVSSRVNIGTNRVKI